MKPRILFVALLCALLYGWYQIAILPNASHTNAGIRDIEPELNLTRPWGSDMGVHASALTVPTVW